MKVKLGKTRFGRHYLFFEGSKVRYDVGLMYSEISSRGKAYLYYKGGYAFKRLKDDSFMLELYSNKHISDVIVFSTKEKVLSDIEEYEVSSICVYNRNERSKKHLYII